MRGGTGEGPAVGEEDLRQVQGDPPARPGHGHLRQRPAQAAPGLREYLNMARLAGVDLPREKRMEVALTYIYGIGKTHAKETLAATGVSPDLRSEGRRSTRLNSSHANISYAVFCLKKNKTRQIY